MASGWEVCCPGRFLIDAGSSGDPLRTIEHLPRPWCWRPPLSKRPFVPTMSPSQVYLLSTQEFAGLIDVEA